MISKLNDKTIKICCGKRGCPTITDLGDGMVEITDDNENKIVVKAEEALLLSDGVKLLNGEKLLLE